MKESEQKDVKIDEHHHHDAKKISMWESDASPSKNRKKEIKKQNLAKG